MSRISSYSCVMFSYTIRAKYTARDRMTQWSCTTGADLGLSPGMKAGIRQSMGSTPVARNRRSKKLTPGRYPGRTYGCVRYWAKGVLAKCGNAKRLTSWVIWSVPVKCNDGTGIFIIFFSSYFLGIKGNMVVAVKTLKNNAGERERLDLAQELQVMKSLEPHPHVVKLLGCCTEKGTHVYR